MDLARQGNDSKLIAEISDETAGDPYLRETLAAGRALGEELLAEILNREREARTFTQNEQAADRYVVALPDRPPRLFDDPFGWDDDDDDDDDYDDDDSLPFDPFESFGGGRGGKPAGGSGSGRGAPPLDPEMVKQLINELLGPLDDVAPPRRRKRKP